jgi:hypothetical protein
LWKGERNIGNNPYLDTTFSLPDNISATSSNLESTCCFALYNIFSNRSVNCLMKIYGDENTFIDKKAMG